MKRIKPSEIRQARRFAGLQAHLEDDELDRRLELLADAQEDQAQEYQQEQDR